MSGSANCFCSAHCLQRVCVFSQLNLPSPARVVAERGERAAERLRRVHGCLLDTRCRSSGTRCRRSATSCHSAIVADLQYTLRLRSPNTPPTRWRDLNGAAGGTSPLAYARACSNPSSYAGKYSSLPCSTSILSLTAASMQSKRSVRTQPESRQAAAVVCPCITRCNHAAASGNPDTSHSQPVRYASLSSESPM